MPRLAVSGMPPNSESEETPGSGLTVSARLWCQLECSCNRATALQEPAATVFAGFPAASPDRPAHACVVNGAKRPRSPRSVLCPGRAMGAQRTARWLPGTALVPYPPSHGTDLVQQCSQSGRPTALRGAAHYRPFASREPPVDGPHGTLSRMPLEALRAHHCHMWPWPVQLWPM